MAKELTTEQKWQPVDYIIDRIRHNRKQGNPPYEFPNDAYIDHTFGDRKPDTD